MNERIKQLAEQAEIYAGELIDEGADYNQYPRYYTEKFAELIVADYARKTIQGLMSDPAFVQAMDEYYENKWSHRFD
jgi:hypothetical protein